MQRNLTTREELKQRLSVYTQTSANKRLRNAALVVIGIAFVTPDFSAAISLVIFFRYACCGSHRRHLL